MQRNEEYKQVLLSPIQARTVAKAYFSSPASTNPDAAQKALENIYTPNVYEVRRLGGMNNTNFFIRKKDDSSPPIIIQLGERGIANDAAIAQLSLKKRPDWLPKHSTLQFRQAGETTFLNDRNKRDPELPRIGCMTTMEVATPLTGHIRKIQDESKEAANFDKSFELVKDLGGQVSNLLSTLSENNIIWTDLKSGNLLLDPNNKIMIADTKAFLPVSMLELRANGNVSHEDVSGSYLSNDFLNNRLTKTPPNQALAVWEKEYSNQLARVIYHAATNTERLTASISSPEQPFNFNHPVFQSEKGRRLIYIIKNLSHEDPNMRIHHTDAAKLLAVIDNDKKFEAAFNEVKKMPEVVEKIVKKHGDKPIDLKVIADVVVPQRFYEFAKIMEEEKKRGAKQDAPGYSYAVALMVYNVYAANKPAKDEIDYDNPIFKGEKGKQLKTILKDMLEDKLGHADAKVLLKKMAEETSADYANQPALMVVAPKVATSSTASLYQTLGTPSPAAAAPTLTATTTVDNTAKAAASAQPQPKGKEHEAESEARVESESTSISSRRP